jgi:hypothetical protein
MENGAILLGSSPSPQRQGFRNQHGWSRGGSLVRNAQDLHADSWLNHVSLSLGEAAGPGISMRVRVARRETSLEPMYLGTRAHPAYISRYIHKYLCK